ncbi:MAG: dihydroneopterin aldolase [Mitsuaria chitosanitabida]|nr:dihydroneopterin aldolase [Roseateles chitosanitabidus]
MSDAQVIAASQTPPQALPPVVDAAIIGGGPAGCSAASWLAQLGLSVALIERAPRLCGSLQSLTYRQDWLLGAPGETLASLGDHYAAHTQALPGVHTLLGRSLDHLDWQADAGWTLYLDGDGGQSGDGDTPAAAAGRQPLRARSLLLATGLTPRHPAPLYPEQRHERVMDALELTSRRERLAPGRVLLLGGGDNAIENALYLSERGHQVTLWSRSDWRAQSHLIQQLDSAPALSRRPAQTLPTALAADAAGVTVTSKAHGDERFDHVAVLLGYEPEPSAWLTVSDALQRAGVTAPSQPFRDEPRFGVLGLFVAGDASGRQHPCVQTALGDGVVAAKQIEAFLRPLRESQPPPALRRNNRQVIHINGLRFGANLGVLDFEREGPQPIQVDAEVNLGAQTIVSRDADIGHVLDYRRVRTIIIDECTAEHTDLLEALLGKLCVRLMKLAGVVGVRIKVTKLEIFPDCQVAISAECGQW